MFCIKNLIAVLCSHHIFHGEGMPLNRLVLVDKSMVLWQYVFLYPLKHVKPMARRSHVLLELYPYNIINPKVTLTTFLYNKKDETLERYFLSQNKTWRGWNRDQLFEIKNVCENRISREWSHAQKLFFIYTYVMYREIRKMKSVPVSSSLIMLTLHPQFVTFLSIYGLSYPEPANAVHFGPYSLGLSAKAFLFILYFLPRTTQGYLPILGNHSP